ncbi:hypothetical protein FRC08_000238 [Ceratobasidium sp. 394]|nr:hypothetical protein FRC08_000238 [Ceratobasidium sp. 394]
MICRVCLTHSSRHAQYFCCHTLCCVTSILRSYCMSWSLPRTLGAYRARSKSQNASDPTFPSIIFFSTITTFLIMFYLRTSHMHNMTTNVPKPTTPRPSLYARDKVMSTLRPFGRKSTASTTPPVPDLQRADSKRNRLGRLVKSVAGAFQKDKADKFKGSTSNNIKPLSPITGLRPSGATFDASGEFDKFGLQETAELGSGSESADASHELIDAHSNRDLSIGSFSSFGDILAGFPNVPTPSPISALPADRLVSPSEVSEGFVIDGKVTSVDESAGPRQDSVSDKTRRNATPVSFFERRPLSGEFNRMAVFKRASGMIQKPHIRPLRLRSKFRESNMMPGSNNVNPTPVQVHPMQESPVSSLPPIPDLIVTNYDDSTTIVVKLDEDEEPTEDIDPEFLYPGYVRERYPGDDQYADASYLTLPTDDWDAGLETIEEEDEEAADSYSPNDTSDSSYVNITPSDGQNADVLRLSHSPSTWNLSLQAMEEEDEQAVGSHWSNDTESELELANDSSYVQDRNPTDGQDPDVPLLTHSTGRWNISLEATGEEDEGAAGSYLPDDSELDSKLVSGSGSSSPKPTPPVAPISVDVPLLAPATTDGFKCASAMNQKRWIWPFSLASKLRDSINPTRVQAHPIQQYVDAPRLTLSMSGWSVDLQGIYEEVKERVSLFSPDGSEPDLEPASDGTSSSPESPPPTTPTSVDMPLLAPALDSLPLRSVLSKSWVLIDEDKLEDDAFGIAL